MKKKTFRNSSIITGDTKQLLYKKLLFAFLVITFLLTIGGAQAQTEWPHFVESKDGVSISYEVHGSGETTLVFVHGWSCDSRYWNKQEKPFSKDYKIILIDLAGHGHSGTTRENYTMKSFGEDVKAVVEATGSKNIILIGHSMGGTVIAEAARLMPDKVIGLIGADTYHNVEYPLSQEQFEMMITPLKDDFQTGTRHFVQEMLIPHENKQLQEWIKADMSAAPSAIALSAFEDLMTKSITGEAAKIFEDIGVPILSVNCSLWPTDLEANRKHMRSFDVIIVENTDHFLMMMKPDEFNNALKQSIKIILEK